MEIAVKWHLKVKKAGRSPLFIFQSATYLSFDSSAA